MRRDLRTLDHGKSWCLIEYKLTLWEWIELGIACIRAFFSIKPPAYFMSIDLEKLLCFHVPTRHKIVKINIRKSEEER